MEIKDLEKRLEVLEANQETLNFELVQIRERNSRVEGDKGWEVSFFRVAFITAVTYLTTAVVFYIIGVKAFLSSALIPTVGYLLSTQSIPFLKKRWVRRRK